MPRCPSLAEGASLQNSYIVVGSNPTRGSMKKTVKISEILVNPDDYLEWDNIKGFDDFYPYDEDHYTNIGLVVFDYEGEKWAFCDWSSSEIGTGLSVEASPEGEVVIFTVEPTIKIDYVWFKEDWKGTYGPSVVW